LISQADFLLNRLVAGHHSDLALASELLGPIEAFADPRSVFGPQKRRAVAASKNERQAVRNEPGREPKNAKKQ
jgi:hypothetical protein